MRGTKFPSPLLYRARELRSLTVAGPPLRAEAQIARNEFLMIILFYFSLFFFPPPRDGIYRAALYTRVSRATGTSHVRR